MTALGIEDRERQAKLRRLRRKLEALFDRDPTKTERLTGRIRITAELKALRDSVGLCDDAGCGPGTLDAETPVGGE